MQTHKYGFDSKSDYKDTNFYEYFNSLLEQKKDTSSFNIYKSVLKTIKEFKGDELTFSEITEDFGEKYLRFLQNKKCCGDKKLMTKTIKTYFEIFTYSIRRAVKDKVIKENLVSSIQVPRVKKAKIIYLTEAELKLLVQTDCKHTELKRAYIFCCLTGLRWSDVSKLTWGEIAKETNNKYSIIFRQKKTQELNYLPLSERALTFLGERKTDNEKVFNLPSYTCLNSKILQSWCGDARVNKKIHFILHGTLSLHNNSILSFLHLIFSHHLNFIYK